MQLHFFSKYKGVIFASFTALLWGFLAVALKISLADLSPVDVVWFRFAIAFVGLAGYYLFSNPKQLSILVKPPWLLILGGVCLGLNYLGFITGINYTSPSIAQVFIQMGPVILAISGFVFYKESITWKQLTGFLLTITGFFLFYNEQLAVLIGDPGIYNRGILWVIFGAMAWAGYSIIQKILVRKRSPMPLNLVLFGLPSLFYLPFVNFGKIPSLSPLYWGLLIFLGLNTLFAYGSLALALKYLEANKISVVIMQNPIITFIVMAILGAFEVTWITAENFTVMTIIGAAMVIFGAVLAVFYGRRKKAVNSKQ